MFGLRYPRFLAPPYCFSFPNRVWKRVQVLKLRFHLYANIYAQCFATDGIKEMKQSFGEKRVPKLGA